VPAGRSFPWGSETALLKQYLGLDATAGTRLLEERPAPDYCALSLKAIEKLSPLMEAGMPFKEAEKQVYASRDADVPVLDQLPTVREFLSSLRNPAVERALTEMRKVVNALVREFGKPYQIRIELARELKKPRALRVKDTVANRKREAENGKLAKRMAEECGLQNPTRRQLEKAKLWVEQKGVCPYTGTGVPFSRLFQDDCGLDVDHILPRSRYPDDSYQNKILCSLEENRNYKRNQTPFEAYAPDAERWSQILSHVKSWGNSGKLAKFLLDSPEKLQTDFTARQMNDTRHTSRLAARLLGALYGGTVTRDGTGDARQVIFSSSGTLSAVLRKTWGFEAILQDLVKPEPNQTTGKPRTDHRHHAIDAIVIALTRNSMIQQMARDNQLRPWQPGSRAWHRVPETWTAPALFASIREQIAGMHVSHRPEHKISGELHKGSNYGRPRLESGKSVVHNRVALSHLSVKDINDDEMIVDGGVREAVRTKLAELGGDPKLFAVPGNEPVMPAGQGRTVPIRKVRIRENKTPLKVGQGVSERWVSSGGINHVELFVQRNAQRKESWVSCVVQRPEAYERRRRKLPVVARSIPNSDAEFLFSLAKDDTLEVDWEGERAIFRVKKFFDNGQIWFVPVNDAHEDAKQTELKLAWSKRPNTLKPLRARKVVVDLLGRVHPAHD
jgi:CRISPR-associated endonuclease Csn1